MKRSKILITLLLALTAVGCRHDEGDMVLELRSESLGGHKMAVENQTAEWSAGDSVWVNGERYAISFSNGQAKILVPHSPTYNAVFPASIMTGNNQVTLPSEYHYATDASGRQLLNLPMVATSTGNSLFFYHLTGALIVKYVNHRSETVTVDRVTVSSNDFAICGTRDITFGDTAQTPSTTGGRSVTVWFDRQVTTLASGDTLAVMVPVAPVDTSNLFTVEVSSHVAVNRYTVSNTQGSAHAFPRNGLGYAYMAIDNSTISTFLFPHLGGNVLSITSANDFKLMQMAINNGWQAGGTSYSTFTYSIDADIDMSGIEIEPIHGFTGSAFNGNGNTISNLTIRSNTSYCALFDIFSSNISDITLSNIRLISEGTTTERNLSPFVGQSTGSKTYNNLSVDGINVTITGDPSGNIVFGGIAATSGAATSFVNCHFDGTLILNSNSTLNFGGILGACTNSSKTSLQFSSCSNNNALNATLNANGIIYAGGLVGYARQNDINVTGQTSLLNITANTTSTLYLGGFFGRLDFSNSTLTLSQVPSVSGTLSYSTTPSTAYIGTLYGRGKPGYYNLVDGNNYTSSLTIPTNSGNIHTGNPSYQ